MKSKIFYSAYIGILVVLLMGGVSAVELCIDLDRPDAPAGLNVSYDDGFVLLVWEEVIDETSCSGIDSYVISFEGDNIDVADGDVFSFIDVRDLSDGEYTYSVYAIDKGGNKGDAIANTITIGGGNGGNGGGTSGGSSSLSYVCVEDWSCDEWSECVGNNMRRGCGDLSECGTEKDMPSTYQECGSSSEEDDMSFEVDEEDVDVSLIVRAFSAITGAVVGGGAGWGIVVVVLVVVGGGYWFVRYEKKRKKKSKR